jgi:hypothetical protein
MAASLIALAGMTARAGAADSPAYTPTLEDIISIQNALDRYHQGLDSHDGHLLASAFTEDGTLSLEAPDRAAPMKFTGRDEIATKGVMGPPPGAAAPSGGGPSPGAAAGPGGLPAGEPGDIWHYSTNDHYEFESPTRVKHYAYWLDVHPGTGMVATIGNPGHYDDILVKRKGEWLLLERKIIVGRK